jgi:hypothetical protein
MSNSFFPRLEGRLGLSIYALLFALLCMLLTPLSAAACGGMFSADAYTEQSAERLIFAVGPGQVTLYEQIHYTGSPKDFAWVLPVPAVPTVGTAQINLFQNLDQQTAPRFYTPSTPSCGFNGGTGAGAPAPRSESVNVYGSGTVGPYNYDVIGSGNPQALVRWLTDHHYKIPAESKAEMQPYIAAHMFFLAMRLQGSASIQDITPVKISYANTGSSITIPLRMATPMGQEPLGVQVWIFAKSRYVPQNYQTLQLDYNRLATTSYPVLVNQAVSKAGGHGFVAEYAQPTSNLSADDPELATLKQSYSYLTRLYTNLSPAQINLDPSFVAQTGLPNVDPVHEIAASDNSQPACPPMPLAVVGVLLGGGLLIALGVLLFIVLRRRAQAG